MTHTRQLMRDALVDALESGEFKQTKGVRKLHGAYSFTGLIGKVAAKIGVGKKGERVSAGTKALSFPGGGTTIKFSSGYSIDLATASDSGVTFPTLAGLIEDWRADRRKNGPSV